MGKLKLQPKHWRAISTFIASIATMVAGLAHGWNDVLSTTFVAGVLMQTVAIIDALTAGSAVERDPERRERVTDSEVNV